MELAARIGTMANVNSWKERYEELLGFLNRFFDRTTVDNEPALNLITSVVSDFAFMRYPSKITASGLTEISSDAFRDTRAVEINLPNVVRTSGSPFIQNATTNAIRLDSLTGEMASSSMFTSCTAANIYIPKIPHTHKNFPWRCTNAATVFHCSDGDYDYLGNPVSAPTLASSPVSARGGGGY